MRRFFRLFRLRSERQVIPGRVIFVRVLSSGVSCSRVSRSALARGSEASLPSVEHTTFEWAFSRRRVPSSLILRLSGVFSHRRGQRSALARESEVFRYPQWSALRSIFPVVRKCSYPQGGALRLHRVCPVAETQGLPLPRIGSAVYLNGTHRAQVRVFRRANRRLCRLCRLRFEWSTALGWFLSSGDASLFPPVSAQIGTACHPYAGNLLSDRIYPFPLVSPVVGLRVCPCPWIGSVVTLRLRVCPCPRIGSVVAFSGTHFAREGSKSCYLQLNTLRSRGSTVAGSQGPPLPADRKCCYPQRDTLRSIGFYRRWAQRLKRSSKFSRRRVPRSSLVRGSEVLLPPVGHTAFERGLPSPGPTVFHCSRIGSAVTPSETHCVRVGSPVVESQSPPLPAVRKALPEIACQFAFSWESALSCVVGRARSRRRRFVRRKVSLMGDLYARQGPAHDSVLCVRFRVFARVSAFFGLAAWRDVVPSPRGEVESFSFLSPPEGRA